MRLEGAAGNSDVSRDLVPLLSSTTSTMDRVFPDDQISEVKSAFSCSCYIFVPFQSVISCSTQILKASLKHKHRSLARIVSCLIFDKMKLKMFSWL